jgi:hypothetical protein
MQKPFPQEKSVKIYSLHSNTVYFPIDKRDKKKDCRRVPAVPSEKILPKTRAYFEPLSRAFRANAYAPTETDLLVPSRDMPTPIRLSGS